jgi:hypothetical protein
MSECEEQGYNAYHSGHARRDDPYWVKGSTTSNPQSREWCKGWDKARLEEKGDTSKYPFGRYN